MAAQPPAPSLEILLHVVLDSAGNLIIADPGNNRVRKVTAATGIITTIAGNGTAGYSGDGGPATSAALHNPEYLTLDSAGNLYIGDYLNNRVRKVNAATGIITTVAGNGTGAYTGDGGAATSAELHYPSAIAFDNAGNLYVSDLGNNRIRKLDLSQSQLTYPTGDDGRDVGFDGQSADSHCLEHRQCRSDDSAAIEWRQSECGLQFRIRLGLNLPGTPDVRAVRKLSLPAQTAPSPLILIRSRQDR